MVMKNRTIKYSSRIGQNTGTSNNEKKVMKKEKTTDRVQAYQNLNSGNRLAKGLYFKKNIKHCQWSSTLETAPVLFRVFRRQSNINIVLFWIKLSEM